MKKKLLYALLMCLALNWHIKDKVRQKECSTANNSQVTTKSVVRHASKKSKASNASRTSNKGKPITPE